MIVTPTMRLSQRAEPSPLWSKLCPETRIGQGLARIARVGCDQAKRGCASRVPLLARRNGAPHGRGEGGESDPGFFGAGAPRAGVKVDRGPDTFTPLVFRVALTTVIPGGKAIERLFALTVDACVYV